MSFERPLARGFLDQAGAGRAEGRRPSPIAKPSATSRGPRRTGCPPGAEVRAGGRGSGRSSHGPSARASRSTSPSPRTSRQHPEVLDGHRLFLSVGHDEYWSWGMRDTVEAFLGRWRPRRVLRREHLLVAGPVRGRDDGLFQVPSRRRPRRRLGRTAPPHRVVVRSEDRAAGNLDDRALVLAWRLLPIRGGRSSSERCLHGLATRSLGVRRNGPSLRGRARPSRCHRRVRGRRMRPDDRGWPPGADARGRSARHPRGAGDGARPPLVARRAALAVREGARRARTRGGGLVG